MSRIKDSPPFGILKWPERKPHERVGGGSVDSRGARRAWCWWRTARGTPWWWGSGPSGTDAPRPWTLSPGRSRSAPQTPTAPRPWGGSRWCPPRPGGTCPSAPAGSRRSGVYMIDVTQSDAQLFIAPLSSRFGRWWTVCTSKCKS